MCLEILLGFLFLAIFIIIDYAVRRLCYCLLHSHKEKHQDIVNHTELVSQEIKN